MTTTTTTMNSNNQAAAQAEGFMSKIRNAMNTLIHSAPEVLASATEKLNDLSSASDEEVQAAVKQTFEQYADTCRGIAGTIRRIPSQADSVEVHNLKDAEEVFRDAVEVIRESKGFVAKAKTTVRLIATALYMVAKKCGQFALKAAKSILVTGIRIVAVGASFIVRIVTTGAKAVRNGFKGLKAWKQAKKNEKARNEAMFTVDDMDEEEFVVTPDEEDEE